MKMENREIKFRAFNATMKVMAEVSTLYYDGTVHVSWRDEKRYEKEKDSNLMFPGYVGDDWNKYGRDDAVFLMQYTGLKDSKGVEIFEGDILDDCGRNWLVKASEGGAWMLDYANGSGEKFLYPLNKHIEIIGNRFENAELLNHI